MGPGQNPPPSLLAGEAMSHIVFADGRNREGGDSVVRARGVCSHQHHNYLPPPPLTTGTCPATGVQLAAQLGKQFAHVECATLGVCLSLLANLLCSNRALLIYNHGNNAKRCACLYFGLWKPERSLFLSLGFGEAGWVWRHGAGPGGHICSCVTSNAELPF